MLYLLWGSNSPCAKGHQTCKVPKSNFLCTVIFNFDKLNCFIIVGQNLLVALSQWDKRIGCNYIGRQNQQSPRYRHRSVLLGWSYRCRHEHETPETHRGLQLMVYVLCVGFANQIY